MKYFIKPLGTSGKESKKDSFQSKLYVAYINLEAVNDPDDIYLEETGDDSCSYKASVYISPGETMSHNPMPVILSQEEEMMLFNEEY